MKACSIFLFEIFLLNNLGMWMLYLLHAGNPFLLQQEAGCMMDMFCQNRACYEQFLVSPSDAIGARVLGFARKRGAFDDDTSTLILCPLFHI